ncbi:Helix-turn-helix domain containing protein [uncultured Caudovirales phage]|jgi:hypothetical protein|uniref:Helix-turn-helix domain containing protein n=1 Tax=uncultured Caudovirales phage TaxID=2100421 RepID=A0A6J5PW59_9CAUD|nr:Helix-turn-helix domain containing protein [uncultured Caudovirales phage]CAB4173288.1 Helix-turn-helix domain containing protein [uncultured Caudovirales phage]CAB4178900.1 Helix-turn-helix domain containing protein [uncultured Caudovirales phage]CAB4219870.1 Helix-turn-helix domain containing protein [uncultured Caudovirales phage]
MTQNQMILKHLKTKGGITTMKAFTELGITRLASRIVEIRHAGNNILDSWISVKNRDGNQVRVKRYTLAKGGK